VRRRSHPSLTVRHEAARGPSHGVISAAEGVMRQFLQAGSRKTPQAVTRQSRGNARRLETADSAPMAVEYGFNIGQWCTPHPVARLWRDDADESHAIDTPLSTQKAPCWQNFLTVGWGSRRSAHVNIPAIPDQRVARSPIVSRSGWGARHWGRRCASETYGQPRPGSSPVPWSRTSVRCGLQDLRQHDVAPILLDPRPQVAGNAR
jgi:hypothetical protein